MKNHKTSSRSTAVYGLISIVGLFLFMLVLPNILDALFGYGSVPSSVIILVALPLVLTPLALLSTFGIFFGKSNSPRQAIKHGSPKLFAVGTVASILLSYVFTIISEQFDPFAPDTPFYILQNFGVAATFAAFSFTLLLINSQKFVYFPFWNKNDRKHADERQLHVRSRVFEKAYVLNIILAIVVVLLWGGASDRMQDILGWSLVISLIALPSIIAARAKNS